MIRTSFMEEEELNIIKGIRSGEESAFRQLYDLYYTRLVMFARKYLDDMEIARDIVQEFFVQLYESRESLSIQTSIKSYLYSSVRNRSLNYLKHMQVRDKHQQIIKQTGNGFDQEIEEKIDAAELETRIFTIVSNLPEQCRRIYILSRVDGKPNREIADELDLSIRTVETQISKALKALRNNLLPLQN
ncbi:RNA polymerase sigma-70 factor [Bacteroidota bacterium]